MNQLSLRWRLSGHMTAGDFRKRLRSADEKGLPNLLFWHDDSGQSIRCGQKSKQAEMVESVAPHRPKRSDNSARRRGPSSAESLKDDSRVRDDAMPMIRFFHTRTCVGIHFVGPDMIKFASDNIPAILDAADLALKSAPVQTLDFDLDIKARVTPRTYFIPSLALRRPNFDFLSVEKYCARIIEQDIRRQCMVLGLDAPDNLYVRIASIGDKGTHWVRMGSGPKTGGALRLKDVKFICNVDLKGSWVAGSLTSKGFGSILNPAARGASMFAGQLGAEDE